MAAYCLKVVWGMLSLMVMTSLSFGDSNEDMTGLLPRFTKDVPNITVTVGRDALLPCTVEQLRGFKVAWVQVDTQTILTIHKLVITRNPRIALLHNDHRSWHLEIKNVRESDRGWYMCQVNTDPMRSRQGYVDVVVPPDIIDKESSGDITVREGQDVTLTCRAKGHPAPNITWRREDNRDILLNTAQRSRASGAQGNSDEDEDEDYPGKGFGSDGSAKVVKGETLVLRKVSRLQMGSYLCIASNGIPPSISKRAHLSVQFPPMAWVPQQLEGAYIGQELTIECRTEAFPKSLNYWTGPSGDMIVAGHRYETLLANTSYKVFMMLRIRSVTVEDFGTYCCVAKNSLGMTDGIIRVYEIDSPKPYHPGEVTAAGGETNAEDFEERDGHSPTPSYKQEKEKYKSRQSGKGLNEVTGEQDPGKSYGREPEHRGRSTLYEYTLEDPFDHRGASGRGGGTRLRPSMLPLLLLLLLLMMMTTTEVVCGHSHL
ncbi:neurotrimin-like [Portunus trituberculatus]|uniref:neurotrimin-like n=1 Tax=Portunus trituberculatus TaxID=210409 RepID=UPI001E1CE100|nr:neurotrimin-like [Portunus trituberculatus]XP_045135902.1 neurotrimin-like [Portunus trituberculatus]XP_045135903.1 neurotrimin-like [Portunus trituberculatus]